MTSASKRISNDMQRNIEVTMRDFPRSDALDAHIRQKAVKLEHLYGRILGCRVVVEQPQRHKHQGKLYCVKIDLKVPGAELVIDHQRNEDVYVALRDAFNAAARKLEDFAHKQRGAVKAHARERPGASEAEPGQG